MSKHNGNGHGNVRAASVRLEHTPLLTKGIRANRHRLFHVSFHGAEFYDLFKLLEGVAEKGGPYTDVRDFVLFSERIRTQLEAQGF